MNYYEMPKEGKSKIRQAICDRAYKEIPNNGERHVVNLGYGVPMGIINCINRENRTDILMQGESCVIGMAEVLEKGDPRIDMHHVTPAGEPIAVNPKGCYNKTVADAFAFIASGKLYATFLGAFQVAENGDLANWAVSDTHRSGAGGAMALCRGAQKVIICMIEENAQGVSKLVKRCNIPLTAERCVSLVVTDKGVYKPAGDKFEVIEVFDLESCEYVKK